MRFSRAIVLALCTISGAGVLPAEDFRLVSGIVLKDARIVRLESGDLVVAHRGGEMRVAPTSLDAATRARLRGERERPATPVKPQVFTLSKPESGSASGSSAAARDGVLVTAAAVPLVEPFALTPEDAKAKAFFVDIQKKKELRDAKEAPRSALAWAPLEKLPFKLMSVGNEDRFSTPSYLLRDYAPGNTYGAPDPRTGK